MGEMATERKSPGLGSTAASLAMALIVPLLYGLALGPRLLEPQLDVTTYSLIGLAVMWSLALGVVALVLFRERQPPASLGLRRITRGWVFVAIGLGLLLSLLVPLLTLLMGQLMPEPTPGPGIETAARSPVWLVLLAVITAGVTEEVLFRAYPTERFAALTGKPWLGAGLGLLAFVLLHLPGWSLSHVLGVVLPLGVILSGLYLWRRNLLFVMIIHVLIDLPLVFFALLTPAA